MPRCSPKDVVRWRVTYHRCLDAFPPRYDAVRVARPVYADARLGPCTVQVQGPDGVWSAPHARQWRQVALRLAHTLEVECYARGNIDLPDVPSGDD